MNRAVTVSVLVICHNYANYLGEALASLMAQNFRAFEIIFIDDGSNDGSDAKAAGILNGYGAEIPYSLHRLEDVGPSAARNFGAQHARGKYLLPLDADDKISPDYLEVTVKALEDNQGCGFAYVNQAYFGDSHQRVNSPDFDYMRLRQANFVGSCSLIAAAAFRDVGGYDTKNWGYYEDWDLWVRLTKSGYPGAKVGGPLFFYRYHHAGSLSFYSQRMHQYNVAFVIVNNPTEYTPATVAMGERLLAELPSQWFGWSPPKSASAIAVRLQSSGENVHLRFFKAVAEFKAGKLEAARADIALLLAAAPDDAMALQLLAQIDAQAAPG
jgi:glycosyltransferase involved in cell wall biosynthesis